MPSVTKSYMARKEEVRPDWYVIDADGQIVGRLATRIATILMGKHKPEYTPHVDCGDYVVVVNVERLRFGGKSLQHPEHPYLTTKLQQKVYDKYTGYPGGYKITRGLQLWQKNPGKILEEAVRRMLFSPGGLWSIAPGHVRARRSPRAAGITSRQLSATAAAPRRYALPLTLAVSRTRMSASKTSSATTTRSAGSSSAAVHDISVVLPAPGWPANTIESRACTQARFASLRPGPVGHADGAGDGVPAGCR